MGPSCALPHAWNMRTSLLLFSPETSGGLFLTLTPEDARTYVARCQQAGQDAWIIGEALPPDGSEVVIEVV